MSRVHDQNDVSLLYIMLEIHHSGREPSIFNFTFTLILSFIPLGASREERDICLLHVGMPGQGGCCTKIVSLSQTDVISVI